MQQAKFEDTSLPPLACDELEEDENMKTVDADSSDGEERGLNTEIDNSELMKSRRLSDGS